MPNEQNLIPMEQRSPEEAREMGRKGGRASGEARRRKIPLVSSMGAGGKMDPSLITVADISKTYGCALARAVRTRLREHGVTRGIKVVFSPEAVPRSAIETATDGQGKFRSTVGTISYLPAIFGCTCASVAIRDLLRKN